MTLDSQGRRPPTPRNKRYGLKGQRKKRDGPEFGYDPSEDPDPAASDAEVPVLDLSMLGEVASEPDPELLALGLPPEDAAGIQKWHYRALSTMAALVLRSNKISEEQRLKRFGALTLAASRHYPEAAKWDLAQKIARDAEEAAGRKRAKAAARLEKRPAAGGAKVIPIRRDAPVG